MKLMLSLFALLFVAYVGSATADTTSVEKRQGFYERKAEGWFWYETEPEPVEEKAEKKQPPAPQTSESKPSEEKEGPAPFSTAWVREKMVSLKETAIEDPTPENIRAYLYMQKTTLDMASRFSEEYMLQVALDSNLDENTRRPISQFGGRAMTMQANSNKQVVLEKLAQKVGLWFFFASDCSYCHKQAPILHALDLVYGMKTLAISLDSRPLSNTIFTDFVPDRGHAAKYNVSLTPTLMLIKKGEEPVKLSEGMLSKIDLENRILLIAKHQNWLDEDDFNSTIAVRNQLIDIKPSNLANKIDLNLDDPEALVAYIKANIAGR